MNKIITYFGTDGLLHIIVSAILTVGFGIIVPVWLAALITFLIGTAKEVVWDCALKRGTPEYKKPNPDFEEVVEEAIQSACKKQKLKH